jgi:hypothetical protein
VSHNKLRIKGNAILLDYLRSDMLSRVPNHPALGLLVPNQQDSPTAEEDSTQVIHGREEDSTQAIHGGEEDSTQVHGREEDSTQARVEKRKTRSSDEGDSYEVEEILGHRCDNQASIYLSSMITLELMRFDVRVTGCGR